MKRQHKTPCAACPFRRTSLRGWLGGLTPEQFTELAQSETRMPCHTHSSEGFSYADPQQTADLPQCAGRSIYWANQLKVARDPSILQLPQDKETIFRWPKEFRDHHSQPPISVEKLPGNLRKTGIKYKS